MALRNDCLLMVLSVLLNCYPGDKVEINGVNQFLINKSQEAIVETFFGFDSSIYVAPLTSAVAVLFHQL